MQSSEAICRVPPALGATRPWLAQLTRAGIALNRHLVGTAPNSRLPWQGRAQQWRWLGIATPGPSVVELVLADGESRCVLAIHAEADAGIDPSIDLDAFEAEAFVLAATLRHEGVIAHLAALSRRSWRCIDAVRAPAHAGLRDAEALSFSFSLSDSADLLKDTSSDTPNDAQRAASRTLASGHVRLPQRDAERWQGCTGWRAPPAPAIAALRVALAIEAVAEMPFSRVELRALRPGGAVLLHRCRGGTDIDGLHCTIGLPGRAGHAAATLRDGRVRLRSRFVGGPPSHPVHPRKPAMPSHSTIEAPDNASHPPAGAAHALREVPETSFLDALPVALEFHLGQVSLKLSDLQAELAEGSVLEIDQPLGTETVSVRAGGVELARGELVQVGDMIAVRITRLVSRGSV